MLLKKLVNIQKHYHELETNLSSPEIITDREKFQSFSKEIAEAQELANDKDMQELAEAELKELETRKLELEKEIEILLIPKDPYDEKNIILEIRAGTGGEEAALFAGELLPMYLRLAERNGLKTEMMESNPTGLGGYKEAIINIIGKGAYSLLKFESGTHRVQRVPKTESGGRIPTSAATVAVLPEAEEVDIKIEPNDLRIDIYHASGAGGQKVNKDG